MIRIKGICGISVNLENVKALNVNGSTEIDEGTLITKGETDISIDDINGIRRVSVSSAKDAWKIANVLFPTDYVQDDDSTARAGYPIYRSTAEDGYYNYICDLNCRLEINLKENNRCINIWIENSVEAETVND